MPRQSTNPRIRPGPHYVYVVIGTDGSMVSQPEWWMTHARKICPDGCRVECFRLVRTDVKKINGRSNRLMAKP
jgi:hypothetical protein